MSILGNGSTFALSSGSVGIIISLDPPEETLTDVPDDALSTTGEHEMIPGLVKTIGVLTGVAIFDPDSPPPMAGAIVTGTLTYRPKAGQSNGATYAGTGYINRRKPTELALDTRVMVEFSFQFDGKTGPVYAPGS